MLTVRINGYNEIINGRGDIGQPWLVPFFIDWLRQGAIDLQSRLDSDYKQEIQVSI